MTLKNLSQSLDYLKAIKKAKSKKMLKALINAADNEVICSICEGVKNILAGNIKTDQKVHSSLKKHKVKLRKLARRRVSMSEKKRLLQRGGFASLLLSPIISFATQYLAGKLLNKGS